MGIFLSPVHSNLEKNIAGRDVHQATVVGATGAGLFPTTRSKYRAEWGRRALLEAAGLSGGNRKFCTIWQKIESAHARAQAKSTGPAWETPPEPPRNSPDTHNQSASSGILGSDICKCHAQTYKHTNIQTYNKKKLISRSNSITTLWHGHPQEDFWWKSAEYGVPQSQLVESWCCTTTRVPLQSGILESFVFLPKDPITQFSRVMASSAPPRWIPHTEVERSCADIIFDNNSTTKGVINDILDYYIRDHMNEV